MDPLWLMLSIPFTAILIIAGARQFQKHKEAKEEIKKEEKLSRPRDKD
ncbi:hypothetical protein ADIAL_1156 [Alkalibacterium sp. AK22]|nr:hypothetical protein [Alkalibacterium sp. AK22]EXJ23398.1 hypothetical protein ADIAL_1156 [Alkalibacterium sp. AK22]